MFPEAVTSSEATLQKTVLKNFAKLAEKHLCQSLFEPLFS